MCTEVTETITEQLQKHCKDCRDVTEAKTGMLLWHYCITEVLQEPYRDISGMLKKSSSEDTEKLETLQERRHDREALQGRR